MNKKYYNKVLCDLVESNRVEQEIHSIDKIVTDIENGKENGYSRSDISSLKQKQNVLKSKKIRY